MLELIALQNAMPKGSNGEMNKNASMIALVMIIVWIAIWVWALVRAVKCGKGQTKVMHVFFASTSPVLYLLFSYFSKGFCS